MLRAFRLSEVSKELDEKWSQKQRKAVNCNNPKGFSQRAHCDGRKARQSGKQTKSRPVTENTTTIDPSDFEIRNFDKLDRLLIDCCEMVIQGQQEDKNQYGMVAACLLDPDNNTVFGINTLDEATGTRKHAERMAIENYNRRYGEVPKGSIIITTLSPCCHPMDERYGDSCTDIINQVGIHKVYCGYKDPTQEPEDKLFHVMQTRNRQISVICKKFAATFLGKEVVKEDTNISEKDIMAMIKKFLPMAMKELKLKKLPRIVLQKHIITHDGQATFGRFENESEKIYIGIADRHPVDILRTLAHELAHFKQYEQGKMYPGAGETGSPLENDAHIKAGIIMRHFNKAYPDAVKAQGLEIS